MANQISVLTLTIAAYSVSGRFLASNDKREFNSIAARAEVDLLDFGKSPPILRAHSVRCVCFTLRNGGATQRSRSQVSTRPSLNLVVNGLLWDRLDSDQELCQ